ncbi:unnamed protein product [Polarella glacialis]|uniref:MIF4G domain-containing protein n=1 Tax=Polarella glacialis TaxID=89957 RepID=A0A813I365_POLGL|nr:unnamed protein product [Polarella glacialis]
MTLTTAAMAAPQEISPERALALTCARREAVESMRRSLQLPFTSGADAAAKVLAKRAKLSRRWQADHSAFSSLNLDFSGAVPKESPFIDLIKGAKTGIPAALRLSPEPTVTAVKCMALSELLGYRCLAGTEAPTEVAGLVLAEVEQPEPTYARHMGLFTRQQSEPIPEPPDVPLRRQMSEQTARPSPSSQRRTSAPTLPSPSANTYRVQQHRPQDSDLKRVVQGFLNKICPENVASIVEKIAAVHVKELDQLEAIIELIFKKALMEPHYCQTYADLVFSLKSVYPEFPAREGDGGKPVTFRGLVLNVCQSEFEELLASADLSDEEKAKCDEAELEVLRKRRKERMRANMKFIGHLFLRQLLSAKVIGSVICELVLCEAVDQLPEEHALECACELLLAIGHTLESMPPGQMALKQACGRLLELQGRKSATGSKGAYCMRIKFMIQDLLDTRAAGWSKKVFKTEAKTKEEIRRDQEREMSERARGNEPSQHVVAGLRPVYLTPVAAW